MARAEIAYRPAAYHRPANRDGRLCEAKGLLEVAVAYGCSLLVVARSGPAGLDARAVMQAAAIRGGPFVHAAAPVPWAPLAAPWPPRRRKPWSPCGACSARADQNLTPK
ncbi:hypothetical protein [Streptomyces sp. NPDC002640]